MSNHVWPVVGTVRASFGDVIEVARDPASGDVRIGLSGPSIVTGEDDQAAWMTPEQFGEFRELLDRAAMPGQPSTIPHIVTDQASHRRHGCPTCLHADD